MTHYNGGAKEDRTPDLLRARQALSQLSYGPKYIIQGKLKRSLVTKSQRDTVNLVPCLVGGSGRI